MRFRILPAAALLLAAAAAFAAPAPAPPDLVRLRILHTQEHHGQALPVRASSPPRDWGGLSARATLLAARRDDAAREGRGVLTLDSGDLLVGTPLSTAFRGEADLAVVNLLGYDALAIGNHEFDFEGRERRLSKLLGQATFPWLAANIRNWEAFGADGANREYRVFARGGLRVGVIGLCHPWTADISSPPPGAFFEESAVAVRRVLAEHGAEADLWIALSHQETWQDVALLEEVPELDVVVGGHTLGFAGLVTRATWSGTVDEQAVPDLLPDQPTEATNPDGLYVRAGGGPFYGRLGTFLGELDLDVDRSTGRVVRAVARNLPILPATPHNLRMTSVEAFHEGVRLADRALITLETGSAASVQLLGFPPRCGEAEVTAGGNRIEVAWPEPCWGAGERLLLAAEVTGAPVAARARLEAFDGGAAPRKGCAFAARAVASPTPLDPTVETTLAPFLAQLDEKLRVVVGHTEVDLDGRREVVRRRETNLGNLIADIYRETQRTDIAIQNSGGIRNSIPAGKIRLADLLPVMPFANTVVRFKLRGSDLLEVLESCVAQVEQGTGRYPQVSGLCFSFDPARPAGARVSEVFVGQQPLDPEAIYSVASNNFFAGGGDGLALLKDRKIDFKDTRSVDVDVVAAWLSGRESIAPAVEGRATEDGSPTQCERIVEGRGPGEATDSAAAPPSPPPPGPGGPTSGRPRA